MQLTIIERDPLNTISYESFTPEIIASKNRQNMNNLILIGVIIVGVLILLIIIEKYYDDAPK